MTGAVGRRRSVVDLHLHTRWSDGDDSPDQVARDCARAGLRFAAVTDHNTTAGVPAFRAAAAGRFTVVPACEVTASWRGAEAHCLAYWVPETHARFVTRIDAIRQRELDWWRAWIDQVSAFGVPVSWDDVEQAFGVDRVGYWLDYVELAQRAAVTDPRFADYVGEPRRLAAQLCRPGQPLHLPALSMPELADVVGWVAEAGGVAVLAHPGLLPALADDLQEAVRELWDIGLTGLEVWTTWHTARQSARLAAACRSSGLIATAGSDYHGVRVKSWAPAPGLLPEVPVDPIAILAALDSRRPARSPDSSGTP